MAAFIVGSFEEQVDELQGLGLKSYFAELRNESKTL